MQALLHSPTFRIPRRPLNDLTSHLRIFLNLLRVFAGKANRVTPLTHLSCPLILFVLQMAFWGNPITSGSHQIDYFISADVMEHPHRTRMPVADDPYSEQVRVCESNHRSCVASLSGACVVCRYRCCTTYYCAPTSLTVRLRVPRNKMAVSLIHLSWLQSYVMLNSLYYRYY
jgi:hypothetical protein